jgi:ATP-dependent RNA helicase DDX60
MADLVGHFPITTTLVARLLQILSEPDAESYGAKAMKGLLERSRISLGSQHSHQQVLHHFRFSIEYLLRQNLIDGSGQTIALAGLIMHLYYTEPANFALAELLRAGVFHEISRNFNPSKPDSHILEAMVHILAHLFCRQTLKPIDQEQLENVIKESPSKVILEPLPPRALSVLENHNKRVLKIYQSYAIHVGRTQFEKIDNVGLPLSRVTLSPGPHDESAIFNSVKATAIEYYARSPFVASSGHGDCFDTIDDLANNTLESISIEGSAVPSMDDFIGSQILNAYLLDFFKHGQSEALTKANGIRPGEVWYVLDQFNCVLAAIDESLKLVASGINVDFAGDELDKYEMDRDAHLSEDMDSQDEGTFEKSLDDRDAKVCAAFSAIRSEFQIKFKNMWA